MSPSDLCSLPKEKVKELQLLFAQAEAIVKELERHDGDGLDIPSINELRYVGYHVLNALVADHAYGRDLELDKAKRHVQRAIYDAYEARTMNVIDQIDLFMDDYRLIQVSLVIKDYASLKVEVDQVRRFIGDVQKQADSRDEKYQGCEQHLKRLEEINTQFQAARDDLNVIIAQKRRETLRWLVGVVIAVLVAVVGLVVKFF